MRVKMTALVVSAESVIGDEIKHFRKAIPDLDSRSLRILSETSGVGVFPPDRSIVGSIYYLNCRSVFDQIVIGQNMRVFASQWGDAFFWYMNDLLAPGGWIYIPSEESEKRAGELGYYSHAALERLFQKKGRFEKSVRATVLEKSDSMARAPSTLNWLVDHAGAVVHDEIALRAVPDLVNLSRYDDIYLECLLGGGEPLVQRPRDWTASDETIRDPNWFTGGKATDHYGLQFSNILRSTAYLFCGVKYKMPIIKAIIRNHATLGPDAAMVDLGGGYGMLVAEHLLDRDLKLAKGVVCDISTIYTTQAGNLYRAFHRGLEGRFFHCTVKMQDFDFAGGYNVITSVSAFLYVPRELREAALEKAWSALRPGGVMVIFEVPKANPKYKDYDIQFTADEIDGLLSRYGEVHRYNATYAAKFTKEQAGEKPIFRAVAKPLA
jgi:SAM-dependent methyltransferase